MATRTAEPLTQVAAAPADAPRALTLIDCDVHPYVNDIHELTPYLPQRWRGWIEQTGYQGPPPPVYPKVFELASRRDAWPPSGRRPGGDPAFAAEQLLDEWSVDVAILNNLYALGGIKNHHLARELTPALNRWLQEHWLDADDRWRGALCVNPEDPDGAPAVIRSSPATIGSCRCCCRSAPARRTAGRSSGRSSAPPPTPDCRSGSTSAARRPTRSPRAGGRRST